MVDSAHARCAEDSARYSSRCVARHRTNAVSAYVSGCRRRDFNLFKDVFLNGADLFEANKLQKREKSYNYFQTRHNSAKQIRKTERSASRNALQNGIDFLRNAKTLAKNFLHVLSSFDPFDHCLESVNELKNSDFAQAKRFRAG